MPVLMLNIGCGNHPLPGFVNIDVVKAANRRHDVTKGIPYSDNSVAIIFSEHFFEHISQRQGLIFLRECRRVLKPGGILRIAMPDLDDLIERYSRSNWRDEGDMFKMGFEWIDNRCEMLNIALREWGHQWVYNEEELNRVATLAGLVSRGRMAWGKSDIPELIGLEYRSGSNLIMEFSKKTTQTEYDLPMISVLIPAYNPTYFEAALDSAMVQSYNNIEVIVCDDSRDDRIKSIVNKYAKKNEVIRYYKNNEIKGPLLNYIECLSHATGDYVRFLNDDDVLGEEDIVEGVKILSQYQNVAIVAYARDVIDESGNQLKAKLNIESLTQSTQIIEGQSAIRYLLSLGVNYIGEPTACMFRRSDIMFLRPHLISIGGAIIPGLGDLVMWCNLLSQGDLAYISEKHCSIRMHSDQWRKNKRLALVSKNKWLQIRKHAYRLGLYGGVFGALGLPDFFMFLKGIKCRGLSENDDWQRYMPRLTHFAVFIVRAFRELQTQYKRIYGRDRKAINP